MTEDARGVEALLLVDDREENLIALTAILEPLEYRLLTAMSGEEALKLLLQNDVAVILLDVRMPGMDGYETARHIKSRERTSDIPIIFLTAEHAESEQALEAFSAGAVDFMTKPFEAWALRAKVQVFVDLSEKTRLLRRQGEVLRRQLDERYRRETQHLRKLADASLAINSTQTLDEMLRVVNESAREIIGAHEAETLITAYPELNLPERSRSFSEKYDAWAATQPQVELAKMYDFALEGRRPVRMTKRQIASGFLARGMVDVQTSHPLLEGWLAVPLVDPAGVVLGLIQVADKIDGDFEEQDELVLVQLAQLASVAIENRHRYQQEHEVAHELQRSMLPPSLPTVAGVTMAARYRAGGAGTQVGGDWYDAMVLEDGRLLLMVGDVVGRGAPAAAVMGQLRTALRAYALQQFPVTVLMRSLDLLLQDLSDGMIATAVCVVADPTSRELEVVSAGHPPPLLVRADGSVDYVRCHPHTPLGIAETPMYSPTYVPAPPGGRLLLYTDGLVEDRSVPLDVGMRTLATVVSDGVARHLSVEALCDGVLEKIVGDTHGDDVALLAIAFNE